MITQDGTLKLTDFGIAKDTDVTALTGANSTIGTAAYMSPGAVQGRPQPDAQVRPVLARRRVLRAADRAEAVHRRDDRGHVPEARQREAGRGRASSCPTCPSGSTTLICQLLEKKPENRPLDAATVGEMLGGDRGEGRRPSRAPGLDAANARADRPAARRRGGSTRRTRRRPGRCARQEARRRSRPRPRCRWLQRPWVKAAGAGRRARRASAAYLIWPPSRTTSLYDAGREAAQTPEDAGRRRPSEYLSGYGDAAGRRRRTQGRGVYREAEGPRRARQPLDNRSRTRAARSRQDDGRPTRRTRRRCRRWTPRRPATSAGADAWTASRGAVRRRPGHARPRPSRQAPAGRGWPTSSSRDIETVRRRRERSSGRDRRRTAVTRCREPSTPTSPEAMALHGAAAGGVRRPGRRPGDARGTRLATQTEQGRRTSAAGTCSRAERRRRPGRAGREDDAKRPPARLTSTAAPERREASAKRLDGEPGRAAERRDVRNGCRDIDRPVRRRDADPIKAIVARRDAVAEATSPKSRRAATPAAASRRRTESPSTAHSERAHARARCPVRESAAAFERASRLIPGGVNSPARAFGGVGGQPLVHRPRRRAVPLRPRRQPLPRLHRLVGAADPRPRPPARRRGRRPRPCATAPASAPRPSARRELAELIIDAVPSIEMVRMVSQRHRGVDERHPPGPRLHRPRRHRQVRRLLPRPRR